MINYVRVIFPIRSNIPVPKMAYERVVVCLHMTDLLYSFLATMRTGSSSFICSILFPFEGNDGNIS